MSGPLKTGRHIWRMDRTRYDSKKVSTQNLIQYIRTDQGHSGGIRIDPKLQSNVLIPYGWTDKTDRVGSTFDYRSLSEGGLIAGGIGVRQGRQTCFFTAVDPMNVSMLTPRDEPNESRKIPYKLTGDEGTTCLLDLKTAHDKGWVFWQTITHAITFYNQCQLIAFKKWSEEFWTMRKPKSCLKMWNLINESLAMSKRSNFKS